MLKQNKLLDKSWLNDSPTNLQFCSHTWTIETDDRIQREGTT